MANLAIKGHATRGKEVIEILEMLGGKNTANWDGNDVDAMYFICTGREIIKASIDRSYCMVVTLEEFLKKFPYKVGDKVQHKGATSCGSVFKVEKMQWVDNHIEYTIRRLWYNNEYVVVRAEHLQPYKEETMEEKIESFEILESHCADEVKVEFDPSKFEMVKRENGYYVVRKQPQYPKTYEECCEVLGIDVSRTIGHSEYLPFYRDVTCYENNLLSSLAVLRKLLICRDAYWKIAGDWKPEWLIEDKYGICVDYNRTMRCTRLTGNAVLIFPTKEMRDAFKENFDPDIEICKELL